MSVDPRYESFTSPPAFLLRMEGLWPAWSQIQARGSGDISGRGWRVWTEEDEDGGATMHLEVRFEPIRPAS